MSKIEKVIAIIVVIGLVVSMGLLLIPKTTDKSLGDAPNTLFLTSMTNTAVAVGPTSTTLLVPSSGRTYAIFGNASTTNVYLTLGPNATSGSGIVLPAGASYVINSGNQYVGLVTAVTSGGTSTVTESYSQ